MALEEMGNLSIHPRAAKVYEAAPGMKVLQIIDSDENGEFARDIPLACLASKRELLGFDDPIEALEAEVYLQDHGEPEPDPITGKNAYTDVYQLLRRREEARENAAELVLDQDGHTDHQVQVAAAQMAYRAVHEPINGGECAMDRCRREARAKLGLPDPSKKCGAETKTEPPPVPEPKPRMMRAMRPAGGKAQVLDLLAGEADELLACTQRFLHQLSGHEKDHVTPPPPEPEPDPEAVILTADELIEKYQEATHERH